MDRIGLEILITSKASILNFDIDIKFQFSNIGDINIFFDISPITSSRACWEPNTVSNEAKYDQKRTNL